MAIAYQTGTATSPDDLLGKLATFLAANGWTQDSLTADGSGRRLHVHRGSQYLALRSIMNEQAWTTNYGAAYGLGLMGATGYSSGSAWNAQPGSLVQGAYKQGLGVRLPAGSIQSYHLFVDGDFVWLAIEVTPDVWTHLGWGYLQKNGANTSRPFIVAERAGYWLGYPVAYGAPGRPFAPWSSGAIYSTAYVNVSADAFSGWASLGPNATDSYGYTGKAFYSNLKGDASVPDIPTAVTLAARAKVAASGQPLLLPIKCYVGRTAGGYSRMGEVPDVFAAETTGLRNASTITLGSEVYMVFPGHLVRKV